MDPPGQPNPRYRLLKRKNPRPNPSPFVYVVVPIGYEYSQLTWQAIAEGSDEEMKALQTLAKASEGDNHE